ncbi:MAG: SPFH domain-containing protein [Spirochaetia bacterium]|nr:SPFH domain-containing protein [Sphaerochaeta sp.]NCC12590.1 SPFH domain-containing protein [Spirochaetia bacterium]NCC89579.1 SPFH domain-containing protein [Spirochaetia bacterium]
MNDSVYSQEKVLNRKANGMAVLIMNSLLILLSIFFFVSAFAWDIPLVLRVLLLIVTAIYGFVVGPILFGGLKVIKPNEALVLTLFGKYYGTLKHDGFYFVNPFVTAINPATASEGTTMTPKTEAKSDGAKAVTSYSIQLPKKKISLKAMTLNNDRQKINDALGNPIIIGVVVIWKVVDTAKAVFNVDNYVDYLSIQCDSALRNVVRLFPYDSEDDEKSLRGSSTEVAHDLMEELQSKVEVAGLEIVEARITHLSYAPEIAAAMLQRQQASAIIAARQKIVEGAVGMVEMALEQLSRNNVVELDEERKAAMVSNLLVVLCGNRDAQPIVNSGSIY